MKTHIVSFLAVVIVLFSFQSLAQRTCSGSASCGFRGQYRRIECARYCGDLRCDAVRGGTTYVAQNALALVEDWLNSDILVPAANHTFNKTTFLAGRNNVYSSLAQQAYDTTYCAYNYQDGFCEVVFECQHGFDTESATCSYSCPWTYCGDVRPAVSALVDGIFPDFTAMLGQGLMLNSSISNYTANWEGQKRRLCAIGRNAMAAQSCDASTQSKVCDPAPSATSLLLSSWLVVSAVLLAATSF